MKIFYLVVLLLLLGSMNSANGFDSLKGFQSFLNSTQGKQMESTFNSILQGLLSPKKNEFKQKLKKRSLGGDFNQSFMNGFLTETEEMPDQSVLKEEHLEKKLDPSQIHQIEDLLVKGEYPELDPVKRKSKKKSIKFQSNFKNFKVKHDKNKRSIDHLAHHKEIQHIIDNTRNRVTNLDTEKFIDNKHILGKDLFGNPINTKIHSTSTVHKSISHSKDGGPEVMNFSKISQSFSDGRNMRGGMNLFPGPSFLGGLMPFMAPLLNSLPGNDINEELPVIHIKRKIIHSPPPVDLESIANMLSKVISNKTDKLQKAQNAEEHDEQSYHHKLVYPEEVIIKSMPINPKPVVEVIRPLLNVHYGQQPMIKKNSEGKYPMLGHKNKTEFKPSFDFMKMLIPPNHIEKR